MDVDRQEQEKEEMETNEIEETEGGMDMEVDDVSEPPPLISSTLLSEIQSKLTCTADIAGLNWVLTSSSSITCSCKCNSRTVILNSTSWLSNQGMQDLKEEEAN